MQRNRLAAETSPYLLQHADNPVDWYPWGEQALLAANSSAAAELSTHSTSRAPLCAARTAHAPT